MQSDWSDTPHNTKVEPKQNGKLPSSGIWFSCALSSEWSRCHHLCYLSACCVNPCSLLAEQPLDMFTRDTMILPTERNVSCFTLNYIKKKKTNLKFSKFYNDNILNRGDSYLFSPMVLKKKDQIAASVVSIDSFVINNLQHIKEYTQAIY